MTFRAGHDFAADLRPFEYNLISRQRVGQMFGFDMLLAEEGRAELDEHIAFFAQVRKRDDIRKGMLRIRL
jgi:hypothetical protein